MILYPLGFWPGYGPDKITVKSRNDVKSASYLHVLCHNLDIFEDIDLHIFISHCHLTQVGTYIQFFFENCDFGNFEK